MAEPTASRSIERVARATAALGGTLPVALSAAVCLARFLPLEVPTRFGVGFLLMIPLWVGAICITWLAASGARAWLWCAGLSLVLGGLGFGLSN